MKRKQKALEVLEPSVTPIKRIYKNRKAVKNSQQALIATIIDIIGGALAVAVLLKTHKQNAINWRNRGSIPYKYQVQLQEKLKIKGALLDYKAAKFYNPDIESWSELVEDCWFLEGYTSYILSFKEL